MNTETTLKERVKTPEKKVPIETQIEEFLSIVTSFSKLLEQETEELKSANFKGVSSLQGNKRFHARRYQEKVYTLTSRRDELMNVDLRVRERLQQERATFNNLLERNKTALINARESTKRLANHILQSARKTVIDEKKTSYSSRGLAQSYESATTAYSYNEKL